MFLWAWINTRDRYWKRNTICEMPSKIQFVCWSPTVTFVPLLSVRRTERCFAVLLHDGFNTGMGVQVVFAARLSCYTCFSRDFHGVSRVWKQRQIHDLKMMPSKTSRTRINSFCCTSGVCVATHMYIFVIFRAWPWRGMLSNELSGKTVGSKFYWHKHNLVLNRSDTDWWLFFGSFTGR